MYGSPIISNSFFYEKREVLIRKKSMFNGKNTDLRRKRGLIFDEIFVQEKSFLFKNKRE